MSNKSSLRIPELRSEIVLAEPWTFELHREKRNWQAALSWGLREDLVHPEPRTRQEAIEQIRESRRFKRTWLDAVGALQHTLPAGTRLRIDRIYVRAGQEDFNSVTFSVLRDGKQAERFWVKLADANKLVLDSDNYTGVKPEASKVLRTDAYCLEFDLTGVESMVRRPGDPRKGFIKSFLYVGSLLRDHWIYETHVTDDPSRAKYYKTLKGLLKNFEWVAEETSEKLVDKRWRWARYFTGSREASDSELTRAKEKATKQFVQGLQNTYVNEPGGARTRLDKFLDTNGLLPEWLKGHLHE